MNFIVKDSVYNGICKYGDLNDPRNIIAKISQGSNKANYKGKSIVCENEIVTISGCPTDCEHKDETCKIGKVECNNTINMFIEGKHVAIKGDKIIFPGGNITM